MVTRIKRAIIAFIVFLGYCGQSFAESSAHQLPQPRKNVMSEWHEPRSCMHIDAVYTKRCMQELYQIGIAHLQASQHNAAIMRFSQILQVDEYSMVYANRGIAYASTRDYRNARKDIVRAVGMTPSSSESWYNLAHLDLVEKHFSDALGNVTMAITLKPEDPSYYDLRAKIYSVRKQRALATADTKLAWMIRHKAEAGVEARERASAAQ